MNRPQLPAPKCRVRSVLSKCITGGSLALIAVLAIPAALLVGRFGGLGGFGGFGLLGVYAEHRVEYLGYMHHGVGDVRLLRAVGDNDCLRVLRGRFSRWRISRRRVKGVKLLNAVSFLGFGQLVQLGQLVRALLPAVLRLFLLEYIEQSHISSLL